MHNETRTTVDIGGERFPLRMPKSHAVLIDVAEATQAGHGFARAMTAALGLCWDGDAFIAALGDRRIRGELDDLEVQRLRKMFGPLRAQYSAHRFDVLAYGGAVMDELADRGHALDALARAGSFALRWCSGLTEADAAEERKASIKAEVDEKVDFSVAGRAS